MIDKVFKTLGASNHTEGERQENDLYCTDPNAVEWLLQLEDIPKDKVVWECAAGKEHISNVFKEHGYIVRTTDLIQYSPHIETLDFLSPDNNQAMDCTIVTNPPYKYAQQFVEKAFSLVNEGNKVIMFLKIQFLEGKQRRLLFDNHPPKTIWVSSSRISCAKDGEFDKYNGSALCYCWFVWEKGYNGDTVVKWFN